VSESNIVGQKYRIRIAMTDTERDQYLACQRTCRMATISSSGAPHLSALYFVWSDAVLWVASLVRSARWSDVARDSRVSVLVDSGSRYSELRGVEIKGTAAAVGETPRVGEPHPQLDRVELMLAAKYEEGMSPYDGRHAWLSVTPETIVSWDFRKLASMDRA
jgi:hypothetical protein